MGMVDVRVENLKKYFGRVRAVDDVTLHVRSGEFLVLLGPSGCGKTTLLRCIAGLERVTDGRVYIGDRDVTFTPPSKRGIAMVFQSYAIFPHMTVFDNIAFGLKIKKVPMEEIRRRVREVAELLQIADLLDRYPHQLSGGQRQRVAVARALVVEPKVLLLDEPLSNLDALLRLRARAELKYLHKKIGTTTIYVTHDQIEAMSLADRIAVMNRGKILQVGPPNEIYSRPACMFVGGFIGTPPMNFIHGSLEERDGDLYFERGEYRVRLPADLGEALRKAGYSGREVVIGVRAEDITVHLRPAENSIEATVMVVENLGSHNLLTLQVGEDVLKASTPTDLPAKMGDRVWLTFNGRRTRAFDPATERLIV